MKLLLHGDHIEASRQEYIRLKTSHVGKEIRELNGKEINETLLTQAVESSSLFGDQTVVCVENLFSPLGKKAKTARGYADIIKHADTASTIIFWEPKAIGKEILGMLEPDVSIRLFDFPKIIFSFLDSIRPNNTKQTIEIFAELLLTEAPELVWNMLISRIRILIQILDNVVPDRMSSWQLSRLTKQVRAFTMDKLLDMYKNMLQMEYNLKNGNSPFTMAETIKQIILSL